MDGEIKVFPLLWSVLTALLREVILLMPTTDFMKTRACSAKLVSLYNREGWSIKIKALI